MKNIKQLEIPSTIIEYEKISTTSSRSDKIGMDVCSPVPEKRIREKYIKLRYLGKGGYARCYEIKSCDTSKIFACKIVSKSRILCKARNKAKLLSEIRIHRSLNNTGIVKFHKCFEDSDFVYILLEICPNQTLKELIKKRFVLTHFETQFFMFFILLSIKNLHTKNIIHRDIKLGNILLSNNLFPKLGDFGLAAQLSYDEERKSTMCGTPNYIAPEIIANDSQGHGKSVDIWSCGVVLYALALGYPPFETSEVKITYRKIKYNDYSFPMKFEKEHPKMTNLIKNMLNGNPERRYTVEQCLNDPFFDEIKSLLKFFSIDMNSFSRDINNNENFPENDQISILPLSSTNKAPQKSDFKKLFFNYLNTKNNNNSKINDIKTEKNNSLKKDELENLIEKIINLKTFEPSKEKVTNKEQNKVEKEGKKSDDDKIRIIEFVPTLSLNDLIASELVKDSNIIIDPIMLIKKCFSLDRFIDYSYKYGFAYSLNLNLEIENLTNKINSVFSVSDRPNIKMDSVEGKKIYKIAKNLTENVGCFYNDESHMISSGHFYMYSPSPYDEIHKELNKKEKCKEMMNETECVMRDVKSIKNILQNPIKDQEYDLEIYDENKYQEENIKKMKEKENLNFEKRGIRKENKINRRFNEKSNKEEEKPRFVFKVSNFPKILKKKVLLLSHFKKLLETQEIVVKNLAVWIEKVYNSEYGVIFVLSNDNICAIFKDKSQMLVSIFKSSTGDRKDEKSWVVYIDKEEKRTEILTDLDKDLLQLQINHPGLYRRIRFVLHYIR